MKFLVDTRITNAASLAGLAASFAIAVGCTKAEESGKTVASQESASAPAGSVDAASEPTRGKAEKFKKSTLAFKGFYLGMPVADAQETINRLLGLEQIPVKPQEISGDALAGMVSTAMSRGFEDAFGELNPDLPFRTYSRKNGFFIAREPDSSPFAYADPSGKVTRFDLSAHTIRGLFGDLPTEEFLQTFVNAYQLPELEPEIQKITATVMGFSQEIGFQNLYRHRNKKGFEIIYYDEAIYTDDSSRGLADTPPKGTMTIQKIETAKQREAKFD